MSSGKKHHSQNLIWGTGLVLLLVFISGFHQGRWDWLPYLLVGFLSFLLANSYVTPDLDLWHSHPRKAWGKLSFVWAPFAWAIKHRSWRSHSFIIGTIIRLAYVLNLTWIIILAILFILHGPWYLLGLVTASLLLGLFIISFLSSWILIIILVVIGNFGPVILFCIAVPSTAPWLLSIIGGFIIGDAFHLIYDRIDSFYIGRPRKNGKQQGWRR